MCDSLRDNCSFPIKCINILGASVERSGTNKTLSNSFSILFPLTLSTSSCCSVFGLSRESSVAPSLPRCEPAANQTELGPPKRKERKILFPFPNWDVLPAPLSFPPNFISKNELNISFAFFSWAHFRGGSSSHAFNLEENSSSSSAAGNFQGGSYCYPLPLLCHDWKMAW